MSLFLLRDLPKYESLRCQARRYSGVDPTACEVCLVTLRVASDMLEAIEAYLGKHGLSQGRFTVMMLLNRNPDAALPPSEIAEKAGVTRATMTGLIRGLERERFVERCKCPKDARSCYIKLTKRGRRKLDGMLPDYYERVAGLIAGVGRADRKKLLQLLGRIAQGVPAMRR